MSKGPRLWNLSTDYARIVKLSTRSKISVVLVPSHPVECRNCKQIHIQLWLYMELEWEWNAKCCLVNWIEFISLTSDWLALGLGEIKKRNRQAVRREVARVLKEVRGASAWKSLSNHAAPHQPLDNRLPRADDVLQSVLDAAPVDGLHLDSIIWEQIDKSMADFKWAEEDDYEDLIDTLTQSEQLRKELADWHSFGYVRLSSNGISPVFSSAFRK
ncbi:hypothetical protein CAPTEDRAFT_211570 [Capitella teleta]|uniref:Uncharacterized protein n=1 Tax=Capitella teleta TaxID=283909 RepID=R7TNB2_CAPTE|nr:hypothetical protein CAPTEDRAFT_211570 [Capitella teleta]|eukprot:ELT95323.1 hypothetical protein CAPTEDRAFT_211570 [Capitella teleta]